MIRLALVFLLASSAFAELAIERKVPSTSFNLTDKTIAMIQSTNTASAISLHIDQTGDFTLTDWNDGSNSSPIFVNTKGEYVMAIHSNLVGGADNSAAFVAGAHPIDSVAFLADVDGADAEGLVMYQNTLTAGASGDQNMIEVNAEEHWTNPGSAASGTTFLGDFLDFSTGADQTFRVDYTGRIFTYGAAGVKYLEFFHNDTDGQFGVSSGALGFTSKTGLIHFVSDDGVNDEACYLDNGTFANYHLWNTSSGGQFYTVPTHIFAAGTKIGADSTDVLIDDASNGAGSTTLYIGNETIDTTASDMRLKEDIKPTEIDALAVLNTLEVRDFDWKAGKRKARGRATGLIAQEVYEVLPQVVHKPNDPEDVWSVDYHHIVPYLIQAVKELQAEVDELKSEG